MIARAGGYYRSAFQVFRGATQGDPLPPTILIVVVDAVGMHWVEVMAEGAVKQGVRGQEVRHQNYLLYADDGMVASSYPGWLLGALSTLLGMFYRVVLKTNDGKTVKMVCHSC